jgi:hypothetical protein
MTPIGDRVLTVGALLSVLMLGATCSRSGGVTRIVKPEGEILIVKDRYTLIILSKDIMRQTFGPNWHQLSLFYGSNRAITQDGERAMVTSLPLRPLAKGAPILVISGDKWPDLIVPVYALESRKQAIFAVDTVKGSIAVLHPAELRRGEPTHSPDGRLFFR